MAANVWLMDPEALDGLQNHIDMYESRGAIDAYEEPDDPTMQIQGSTAVISAIGTIFRYESALTEFLRFFMPVVTLESLNRSFREAFDNPAIRQILFLVDSPGGDASGVSDTAEMIRASSKPVRAYVDGMAASGGYWLASAAGEVHISQSALLGSIGVVITGRARDDSGRTVRIISTQSPLKQSDPGTAEGRADWQRTADDLAAVFVASVARYRATTPEKVIADYGRGGLLVGQHAVSAGMADQINMRHLIMSNTTELTAAVVMEEYPAVYDDIHALGAKSVDLKAAATAERERIMAVFEQALPGHDALIREMAFDGHTSGPEAAVRILAAERELSTAHRRGMEDVAAPVAPAEAPLASKQDTFTTKVEQLMAEHSLSRGQATRRAIQENPDLHASWLSNLAS
jgi:ClpP class serine protease